MRGRGGGVGVAADKGNAQNFARLRRTSADYGKPINTFAECNMLRTDFRH